MAQERTMIGPVQALVEQVQAFADARVDAEQRVDRDPLAHQRIAVLVPCYNEEAAIAKVVADFRAALPEADIYVYDNNSRDRTVEAARAAGAIVRSETLQGKGRVVRRMFGEIEADVYILVEAMRPMTRRAPAMACGFWPTASTWWSAPASIRNRPRTAGHRRQPRPHRFRRRRVRRAFTDLPSRLSRISRRS